VARAADLRHRLVAGEPRIGADVDQRPCQKPKRGNHRARALVRLGDELEGDRGDEEAFAERGHDGGDALRKPQDHRDEGSCDEARADEYGPADQRHISAARCLSKRL
jgi:hypothetical protein